MPPRARRSKLPAATPAAKAAAKQLFCKAQDPTASVGNTPDPQAAPDSQAAAVSQGTSKRSRQQAQQAAPAAEHQQAASSEAASLQAAADSEAAGPQAAADSQAAGSQAAVDSEAAGSQAAADPRAAPESEAATDSQAALDLQAAADSQGANKRRRKQAQPAAPLDRHQQAADSQAANSQAADSQAAAAEPDLQVEPESQAEHDSHKARLLGRQRSLGGYSSDDTLMLGTCVPISSMDMNAGFDNMMATMQDGAFVSGVVWLACAGLCY